METFKSLADAKKAKKVADKERCCEPRYYRTQKSFALTMKKHRQLTKKESK